MRSKTKRAVAIVFAAIFILGGAAILKPDWDSNTRVAAAAAGGGSSQPWELGAPVTYQDLTIFPVISSQNPDTSDFETLDQALSSGDAVISEQGGYMRRWREGESMPVYTGGSQVNQLVLVNRGKRPLLLSRGRSRLRRQAGPHHRQGSHRAHRLGAAAARRLLRRARPLDRRLDEFQRRRNDGPPNRARASCSETGSEPGLGRRARRNSEGRPKRIGQGRGPSLGLQ